MIKLMIKLGANLNCQTRSGAGVMHLAAQGDSAFAIAYFSIKHQEGFNSKDSDGQTPLHWATMNAS